MKILADKYLYRVRKEIPLKFQVDLFDPGDGLPSAATEYDALLVRTVTPLNEETLPKAGKLQFVATATAGTDHVDSEHLKRLGITFAHAEGCNANAVAEYVITVMLWWAGERGEQIRRKRVGIVGCGNTGGRVAAYLKKLGTEVTLYDPPKEVRQPGFSSSTVKELLCCDIITFHTPLTRSGNYSTLDICNTEWLSAGWELLINTSRGGVVNEEELLQAHRRGDVDEMVTDVWIGEPSFQRELAQHSLIATPHIAGYSTEAKWMATKMVTTCLMEFFEESEGVSDLDVSALMTTPQKRKLELYNGKGTAGEVLWNLHQIEEYDRELRKICRISGEQRSRRFGTLRSEMPLRSEFKTLFREIRGKGMVHPVAALFLSENEPEG